MNSKGNKPENMSGNYSWNKPGNDQNLGKAGKMSNQSGSKGMSGESRSDMGRMHQGGRSEMSPEQEPKREWGQKHYHGHNADWGKEGHKVEHGPELQWGETSRSHGDQPSGSSMDDQPLQPGHASHQGQGSEISRKVENRKGKEMPKEPRSEDEKKSGPNTDMDWSQ